MNNKIVSTKTTSAIFLAIVLVTGTITAISPLFMVGTAQAQPDYGMVEEYNSYEPDYGMVEEYNSYEPDYGMVEEYNSYEPDYGMVEEYNSYEPDYGMDNDKKPQIFPANKVAELGDEWWKWIASLNNVTDPNPFTELGQAGCDVGLQDDGRLLFLVGSSRDLVTGDFPVHECDIKKGTSILFPILNAECSNVEPEPFFGATEDEQRECANDFIDETDELFLKIDGHEVPNPEQYRVDSPAGGFEFTAVLGNPVGIPAGDGHAVSDGFWILLKNLKPGKHIIEFSGKADWSQFGLSESFEAGATYILDVQPSEKSYYPDDYRQQNYQTY